MSQKSPSFFEGQVLSKQIRPGTNTRRVAPWRINRIKAVRVANKLVVVRAAVSKKVASKVAVARVAAKAAASKVAASKVAAVSAAATASHNLQGLNSG